MTYAEFTNLLLNVLSSRAAQALALSKGGWEGWVQCELWNNISDAGTTVEREYPYPGLNKYCDLVTTLDGQPFWIEIKAFGEFRQGDLNRFLDSYAYDVLKLDDAPQGAGKLALLVIPKNIGQDIIPVLTQRWPAIEHISSDTTFVFRLRF